MDPTLVPDHGRGLFASVPYVAPASPTAPVNAPGRLAAMIGTPTAAGDVAGGAAGVAAVADRAAAPTVADRAFFSAGAASPGIQSVAAAEQAPLAGVAESGPGIAGRTGSSVGAPLVLTIPGIAAGRTATIASKPPAFAE